MLLWPISSTMRSSVRAARLSADVNATSNVMPCALSLRPAVRASATPCGERSTSRQPVNRFLRFHSLWPWRTSTRRRSVIFCLVGKSGRAQAEHVVHGIRPRWLAARPQRRLDAAAGEDHAVFRPVDELDALGGTGEDHAVLARHGAAAHRDKTDIARLARPGVAVAPAIRARGKLDVAARRGGLAEQQGGAGLRVG